MAGTITVGELLSDPTSSNKITIGSGTTLDLVSGAGSVTLPPEATDAASLTGALPALDGSLLTGVGKVLQVVQSTSSTMTVVATSGGFADLTGASATITPSATSSKVLVIFKCPSWATLKAAECQQRLVRGSTTLTASHGYAYSDPVYDWLPHHMAEVHLDSPSTTSATTYKIQVIRDDYSISGASWYVNPASTNSMSMTLLEIGA
jgi:hypothetical protein